MQSQFSNWEAEALLRRHQNADMSHKKPTSQRMTPYTNRSALLVMKKNAQPPTKLSTKHPTPTSAPPHMRQNVRILTKLSMSKSALLPMRKNVEQPMRQLMKSNAQHPM